MTADTFGIATSSRSVTTYSAGFTNRYNRIDRHNRHNKTKRLGKSENLRSLKHEANALSGWRR